MFAYRREPGPTSRTGAHGAARGASGACDQGSWRGRPWTRDFPGAVHWPGFERRCGPVHRNAVARLPNLEPLRMPARHGPGQRQLPQPRSSRRRGARAPVPKWARRVNPYDWVRGKAERAVFRDRHGPALCSSVPVRVAWVRQYTLDGQLGAPRPRGLPGNSRYRHWTPSCDWPWRPTTGAWRCADARVLRPARRPGASAPPGPAINATISATMWSRD